MTHPADNAPDLTGQPEAGLAPPAPGEVGPETEADTPEQIIQRRLSQQGRELAEARRAAVAANATVAQQQGKIGELEAGMRLIVANLSQRDQAEQAARSRAMEAELAALPPADRMERRIQMLQQEVNTLRTAAPSARPAQQQAPAQQPQAQAQPQRREPTDDERRAYMEQRVQEIVREAESTYGVRPDLDRIPDDAWENEDTFIRAAMSQARSAAGGGTTVAQRPQTESAAQLRERIRQEERERLGANSPTAARATPGGRKKAASADDVRAAAQSYSSKLGPKANIARMQAIRDSLG